MRTILITGINGFVGSNLVRALSGKFDIYGLDLKESSLNGVKKTYLWSDFEALPSDNFDAIIHLAGKAHDTKNRSAAEEYFKVNTELTKKIYDYFLKSSAKKFVFFSTAKSAADRVEGILTEEVIPAPVGPYGESKIKAEEYILSHQQTGKSFYILRPCMIHGPGNKGNLNLLFSVVSKGIPWPLGSFENKRTFTSIDNVSFIVEGLLRNEVESGIYNVGDDDALSTNELIEIICKSIGRKAHIWHLPKGFMTFIAKVGSKLHLPLNTDRLQKLTEDYVSSNAKIKTALGVSELPVKSRDGIESTIKSFSKNI